MEVGCLYDRFSLVLSIVTLLLRQGFSWSGLWQVLSLSLVLTVMRYLNGNANSFPTWQLWCVSKENKHQVWQRLILSWIVIGHFKALTKEWPWQGFFFGGGQPFLSQFDSIYNSWSTHCLESRQAIIGVRCSLAYLSAKSLGQCMSLESSKRLILAYDIRFEIIVNCLRSIRLKKLPYRPVWESIQHRKIGFNITWLKLVCWGHNLIVFDLELQQSF